MDQKASERFFSFSRFKVYRLRKLFETYSVNLIAIVMVFLNSMFVLANDSIEPEEELSTDTIQLNTLTVTATVEKPKSQTLPGTTSTIEADTIEKRLVRNIKDLIRYEPGVNVGNDPQRFGATGFTIRGLGGNRVLMQVDGVRLPDSFSLGSFSSATRNSIDMDALKSVEIIRGAGLAQYGSDALGGTVDFVTKDPRDYLDIFGDDYYADLKLGYNTSDRSFLQTTTLAGQFKKWESMLLFTHSKGRELDNKGDNHSLDARRTAPSPQDNEGFNLLGKLIYRFNDDNVFRFSGEWFDSQSNTDALYARGRDFSFRTVNSLLSEDDQTRWRVSLDQSLQQIDLPVADSFFWRAYFQQSDTRQITFQDRTSNNAFERQTLIKRIFSYENENVGGELTFDKKFILPFTVHQLQYGGQISHNTITQKRDGNLTYITGTPVNPAGSTTNFVNPDTFPLRDFPLSDILKAGVYAQDTVKTWKDRIELLPGIRFEYFQLTPELDQLFARAANGLTPADIKAAVFLPKFGTLLHLNDIFTLHGQYTHGFRGPNFSDANTGFTNFQAGYTSIPNVNLQPETSVGAEVGLRAAGNAGSFDVTLFRNDYQNFIYDSTICNPVSSTDCPNGLLTFQTVNSLDPIRIQGIELKSEWYLDWLSPLFDGFSLKMAGSFAEGENLTTKNTQDDALRAISPMKGVVGFRYDRPSGHWGSEIILTMVGRKLANTAPVDAVYLTDGYGVLDFNAYYRIGDRVSVNFGLFNILDKKYIDWEDVNTRASDPHATLGPFASADFWDRYSRPGRNVGFTVKIAY